MASPLSAYIGKAQKLRVLAPGESGVYSPCIQIAHNFRTQSYFDSTVYEKALLAQLPNELIVSSDLQIADLRGYAVGLHPSSETPVAVTFKGTSAESPGASAVLILKPGELLRPTDGQFSGFVWGLPFGWLGGGIANLMVFTTKEADVLWEPEGREILFHRVRLPILLPASVPTIATGRIDWPTRFPWPNAYNTSTNSPQFGNPSISVNATRVLIIPRVTTVTLPTTIRFLMAQVDDYTQKSDGTLDTTAVEYFDAVVPTNTNPAAQAQQTTAYSVLEFTSGSLLRGGDNAVITPMDMGDGDVMGGSIEVDILRYGRL